MAVITVRNLNGYHTNSSHVNPNDMANGIRYGSNFYIENHESYGAYMEFDISPVIMHKISSVTLVRNRLSLMATESDPTVRGLDVTITPFRSKDANTPSILPGNLSKLEKLNYTVVVAEEKATTGELRTDITKIFKKENAVKNILGIQLTAQGTVGVATDTWADLEFEVTLSPPNPPKNLFPTTQQNPRLPISFSWQHSPNQDYPDDPQVGWELEISQTGAETIAISQQGTANSYTLPAGSLTNYNNVTFRVRTQSQNNYWGDWAVQTFAVGETPPLQPILVYPTNGINVPYDDIIRFEWLFNTTIVVKQGGFELQMTRDGEPLETVIETTDATYYEYLTDGFIHSYEWRVSTWNELGDGKGASAVWSAWERFVTSGKPLTPVILNVTNQNMPLVTWGGITQNWQLIIEQSIKVLYDSGIRPLSMQMGLRVPVFLPNGNYTARLRSVSDINVSSDYSIYNFTVDVQAPPIITPVVFKNSLYGVYLKLNGESNKIIIRDGIEIGQTNNDYFIDYTCTPGYLHKYIVRNVTDHNYSESLPVNGSVNFEGTFIAPVDDLENYVILDKKTDRQPIKSRAIGNGGQAVTVIGREYAIVDFSNAKNDSVSLAYSLKKTDANIKKLELFSKASGLHVIRHKEYGTITGVIENFRSDYSGKEYAEISFSVRRTE